MTSWIANWMTTRRKVLVGITLALVVGACIVFVMQLTALSYTGVRDALRAHGESVQEGGLDPQSDLGGADHRLNVNGAGIDVFEYRTTLGASLDASRISSDGSTISRGFGPFGGGTARINYVAPPHWFHAGRVLVRYVGRDDSMLTLLRTMLGAQFAGG
jgi:hypothetical protein